MEDTSSSLSTETSGTETTVNQAAVSEQVPKVQNAEAVSSQQTTQKPQASTVWDYKTDTRWGRIWKSEQDIINGYKLLDDVLEKKYKPTFKAYEDLAKKFKSAGMDLNDLDNYIKEYNTLKSPEHPANQVFKTLQELLADDEISQRDFDLAVAKIQEDKLSRKYPGATKELREQLIRQENETKELKSWKEQLQNQESEKIAYQNVIKGLDTIKQIAESKGFDFTDKIKNDFLTHCEQNDIPTAYIVQEFRRLFDSALDKAYEDKIKSKINETKEENNKKVISMTNMQKQGLNKKENFESKLGKLLTKK